MTIASELQALATDVQNARTAITNKGGTVTASGGTSQLATDIATIPTGGTLKDISPITSNGIYKVFDDLATVDKYTCTASGYFQTDIMLELGKAYDYEVKLNISGLPTSINSSMAMGATCTNGTNRIGISAYNAGTVQVNVYTSGKAIAQVVPRVDVLTISTDFGNSKIYVNGTAYNTGSSAVTSGTNYPIQVLAQNNKGTVDGMFQGMIEYAKILYDGEVIHWFVPAKKADGTPLLLDKVTMTTYALTGTGVTPGTVVEDLTADGFESPITVSVPKETRFGATIGSMIGSVNASGELQPPSVPAALAFNGVRSIAANGMRYMFYRNPCITSVSFPDLTSVGQYGLQYAFNVAGVTGGITSVSFPELTSLGTYAMQYAFQNQPLTGAEVDMPDLTTLGNYCLAYAFNDCDIKSFKANSLTTISSIYAFQYAFTNNTNVDFDVEMDSLTTITANYAFSYAFSRCSTRKAITFPSLTAITGNGAFANAFNTSDNVAYGLVWHPFPALKTVNGTGTFSSAFTYCHATRVVFDSLEYIGNTTTNTSSTFSMAFQYAYMGSSSTDYDKHGLFLPSLKTIGLNSISSKQIFVNAFNDSNRKHTLHLYELTMAYNTSPTSSNGQFAGCNAKRIYLPKVTSLGTYSQNCFYNSTLTEELHFGMENQATIEGLTGYASKFGATNATIYFDMVNHITVDGTVYDRDGPKCDLDNWYFAWTNGTTTLYTTDFKAPAVGDAVYTKSGDTYTQSGTITAIA